jgi:predicted nucleotidyltransferase
MTREELLQQFVTLAKSSLGDNLESVVLYGSTVRGDAQAPYSDLNVLFLVRSTARAELENMAGVVNWWSQGQGQRSPLIFTADELRQSADVFAIELLDMQRAHRVLYGADIITSIPVPMNLHRVQIEHELRTLIQKLRQHYLHGPAEDTVLRTVLAKSFSSVVTLLRHTLIAMDHEAPTDRHDLLQKVHKHLGVNVHGLQAVLELRTATNPTGSLGSTYGSYLETLEKVCDQLDQWLPKKEWQRVGTK